MFLDVGSKLRGIIISSNKSLLIGDYLIDDYNCGKGQESFGGELIHFGSEQFRNWKDVLNFLQPRKL